MKTVAVLALVALLAACAPQPRCQTTSAGIACTLEARP